MQSKPILPIPLYLAAVPRDFQISHSYWGIILLLHTRYFIFIFIKRGLIWGNRLYCLHDVVILKDYSPDLLKKGDLCSASKGATKVRTPRFIFCCIPPLLTSYVHLSSTLFRGRKQQQSPL